METLDTPLARLLHARGLVPLATLQEALRAARAERPDGATLGARLVARGLLRPELAERLLAELATTAHEPAPRADGAPARKDGRADD